MLAKKKSWGSRAVVTGAGGGIGRAFALEIQRRGGRVVCSDIDMVRAEQTAELIRQAGGSALAVVCDVADLAAVERLAEEAEQWFGQPANLIINNAGVGAGGKPIGETPMEDWQWIMGINLWGVIHGCHVFVPKLRELGEGGVINVASAASFGAAPMMAAYNTTKAGVLALSETLRAEVADTDITITVLCPTFVKTDIIENSRIPDGKSAQQAKKLMARNGFNPDAVARKTLNEFDAGAIYVLPQLDAKVTWFMKRMAPGLFTRGMGVVGRFIRD